MNFYNNFQDLYRSSMSCTVFNGGGGGIRRESWSDPVALCELDVNTIICDNYPNAKGKKSAENEDESVLAGLSQIAKQIRDRLDQTWQELYDEKSDPATLSNYHNDRVRRWDKLVEKVSKTLYGKAEFVGDNAITLKYYDRRIENKNPDIWLGLQIDDVFADLKNATNSTKALLMSPRKQEKTVKVSGKDSESICISSKDYNPDRAKKLLECAKTNQLFEGKHVVVFNPEDIKVQTSHYRDTNDNAVRPADNPKNLNQPNLKNYTDAGRKEAKTLWRSNKGKRKVADNAHNCVHLSYVDVDGTRYFKLGSKITLTDVIKYRENHGDPYDNDFNDDFDDD